MLGLCGSECQATLLKKLVDTSLPLAALFSPKLWLGVRRSNHIFIFRTAGSMTCLRNLEYACQAARYVPFSLGESISTRVQTESNDFYYGCLKSFAT